MRPRSADHCRPAPSPPIEDLHRHLVTDMSRGPQAMRAAVYIGCNARHGDVSFGNRPHPPASAPDIERRCSSLHRNAVDAYWRRITDPSNTALLERVRSDLRGRTLACHCVARPCVEAGNIRAHACLPCHGHCLAALANCTKRQFETALTILHPTTLAAPPRPRLSSQLTEPRCMPNPLHEPPTPVPAHGAPRIPPRPARSTRATRLPLPSGPPGPTPDR